MLRQPLLDQLSQLRLPAFRAALEAQFQSAHYAALPFEERLALLVQSECTQRENSRLQRGLKAAHLPGPASLEDLELAPTRGLDRSQVLELGQAEWIRSHLNTIILGPTGTGKTFLATALAHAACRLGYSVRYHRTSRLLYELTLAQADGSYPKLLATLSRVQLLVLDDWLRDPLTRTQTQDVLEILDDRCGRTATMLVTQIPVADWHIRFPDPTLADAILDRLVHTAYRLQLTGESQRRVRSPLPAAGV
jgi:DNA replication protein DnaC